MRKVLEHCPTCNGGLVITHLRCPTCDTGVEGRYSPCRFCRLSETTLEFIECFIRNRGNIREMERELGISYPTVRNRLNEVIREMGYESNHEQQWTRRQILERLDAGEIDMEETMRLLEELR